MPDTIITAYATAIALFAAVCAAIAPPAPAPLPTATPIPTPRVEIGAASFAVEIADSAETRQRGLSGRQSLPDGAGMLFVFESEHVASFWMKEMRFPLDFVWIGENCVVVDTLSDIPPPPLDVAPADLRIYQPSSPVRYVLEINAGEVAEHGIAVGDAARFSGFSVSGAGC